LKVEPSKLGGRAPVQSRRRHSPQYQHKHVSLQTSECRPPKGHAPRDEHGHHAADVGELVGLGVPRHGAAAAKHERKPDDPADDRVGGGHGELQVGGSEDPEHGGGLGGQHAKHEDGGILGKGAGLGDAAGDGLGHVAAEEHGAQELKHGGDDDGGPELQGLGANRGSKGVGDVIGADTLKGWGRFLGVEGGWGEWSARAFKRVSWSMIRCRADRRRG